VVAGALAMAVYAFVLFPLVDSGDTALLTVALVLGQGVIHPMMYGPLAALYSELFSTEHRYTGASLGYQVAGLGAGVAPLLFAEVQRATGGRGLTLISSIVAGFCLLTVVCVLALKETGTRDLRSVTAS
jgi:MFS family permease